jgi:hypothetical protein
MGFFFPNSGQVLILLANYFDGANFEVSGLLLTQIREIQSQIREDLGFASSIMSCEQVHGIFLQNIVGRP